MNMRITIVYASNIYHEPPGMQLTLCPTVYSQGRRRRRRISVAAA
jgi:hypothetical protein